MWSLARQASASPAWPRRPSASERPLIQVLATQSAAALPYGAFAHLLRPGGQRTADVIPAFIQMLRAEHPDAVPVVLVDDGHLLDDASAALVLAWSTTGAAVRW